MKFIVFILTIVLFSCADNQYTIDTQTKADVVLLQTQVQQLQATVDSLVQALHPKPKPKTTSKKFKSKTETISSDQLSNADNSNKYEFQSNNSIATPSVKSTKQDNHYQVRVGAICNDGTRSYATGRGACSHHGGVRVWLYE